MKEFIFIKNKKYITTKAASKMTGYTSDYIGQLSRSGKIKTTMIGHIRYVNEEDITNYGGGGSVSVDGRKYISTKKAAEVTGYTSDYIGQLSRKGNIKATSIGNTKFVDETDIYNYAKQNNKTIKQPSRHASQDNAGEENNKSIKQINEKDFKITELDYQEDESPLIPKIKKTYKQENKEAKKIIKSPFTKPQQFISDQAFKKVIAMTVTLGIVFGPYLFHKLGYAEAAQKGITDFVEETKIVVNEIIIKTKKDGPILLVTDSITETIKLTEGESKKIIKKISNQQILASVSETAKDISVRNIAKSFYSFVTTFFGKETDTNKFVEQTKEPKVTEQVSSPVAKITEVRQPIYIQGETKVIPARHASQGDAGGEKIVERTSPTSISEEELENRIQQLDNKLSAKIYTISAGSPLSVQTVYNTVSHTNKIDQLRNTNIYTPTIEGGTISGASITGSTFSGTTFSGSELTISGSSNLGGDVTVDGQLIVSGTATSTLAGDVSFDTDTLYIDSINNRIGVGTTSPSFALDVNGIVNGTAIYENGSPFIGSQWTTSGSDIYYSTGNIGVGTSSPYAPLSVVGEIVASYYTATSTTATSTYSGDVQVDGNLQIADGSIINSINDLGKWTSSGSDIYYNTGNIGIGTTSPDSILAIEGTTPTITLSDGTYSNKIVTSQAEGLTGADMRIGLDETNKTLVISDSGDLGLDLGLSASSDPSLFVFNSAGDNYAGIHGGGVVYVKGSGHFISEGDDRTRVSGAQGASLIMGTDRSSGSPFQIASGSGDEITASSGEQSWLEILPKINQSSTAGYSGLKLTATETGLGSGSNYLMQLGTSTAESLFVVDNSGNVGIGTASPLSILHIGNTDYTDVSDGLTFGDGDSGIFESADDVLRFHSGGGTNYYMELSDFDLKFSSSLSLNLAAGNLTLQSGTGGKTTISAPGADNIVLNSGTGDVVTTGGNIGIASTTPYGLLSLNPNGITGPSFAIGSSTQTDFVVTNGGNVGIGTASPSTTLHISDVLTLGESGGTSGQINFVASDGDAMELLASTGDTLQLRSSSGLRVYDTSNSLYSDLDRNKLSLYSLNVELYGNGNRLQVNNGSPFTFRSDVDNSAGAYQWGFTSNSNIELTDTDGEQSFMYLEPKINQSSTAGYSGLKLTATETGLGSGSNYLMQLGTSTAESLFVVDNSGNVGIGTASPSALLNISHATYGEDKPEFSIYDGYYTYNIGYDAKDLRGAGNFYWSQYMSSSSAHYDTSSSHIFEINGTEQTRLNNNALGLWDANPDALLEVSASGGVSDLLMLSSDDTNDGDLFIVKNSGNIGIGTTSPESLLTVYSDSTKTGNLLHIATTTTDALVVDDTGDVIIGTDTPYGVSVLTVNGYTSILGTLLSTGTVNADSGNGRLNGSLVTGNTNGVFNVGNISTGASSAMSFITKNVEAMRINPSGNIGIGTTSPLTTLSLEGTAGTPLMNIASSTGASVLYVDEYDRVGIGTGSPDQALKVIGNIEASGNIYGTIFSGTSVQTGTVVGSTNVQGLIYYPNIATNDLVLSSYGTNGKSVIIKTENTERLRVDSSGNIGIGTTTPPALLTLNDPAGTDSFYIGSSTPKFIIKDTGKVGIGTASPNTYLHIDGTTEEKIRLTDNNDMTLGLSLGYSDLGNTDSYIYNRYDGNADSEIHFGFGSNYGSGVVMTLEQSGKVGIGTTTPQSKLTITNAGASGQLMLTDTGAVADSHYGEIGFARGGFNFNTMTDALATTTRMVIDSSGNVGIGTASPRTELEINGDGLIIGSLEARTRNTNPTWTAQTSWNVPDVGSGANPSFADLDNDGDLDLMVDGYTTTYGYKNTGTVDSPIWTAEPSWDLSGQANYAGTAYLVDLDNDGDYDMMLGGHSTMYAYENTGSVTSPTWTAKSAWDVVFGSAYSAASFADLDNDGDYDFLLGWYNGPVLGYENTGSASSPTWTANTDWDVQFSAGSATARPALADLDGDGDFDLLVGDESSGLFAYKNTGTPSSPAWSRYTAWEVSASGALALGDLDNDGDFDLLVGKSDGITYAYKNTGAESSAFYVNAVGQVGINTNTPQKDFDVAGDALITGGLISVGHGQFFGNTNSALIAIQSATAPSAQFKSRFQAGSDLIINTSPNKATTYITPAGSLDIRKKVAPTWSAKSAWNTPDIGIYAVPAFADLDNDGDLDLMIDTSTVTYGYKNTGTALSPVWTAEPTWNLYGYTGYNSTPYLFDIDNDGDYDMMLSGDLTAYAFENTGTVMNPTWTRESDWDVVIGSGYRGLAFADLDNDGDYDFIRGEYNGPVLGYENTGSATSPTWTAKTAWNVTGSPASGAVRPALADLDGDGDFDLTFGDKSGSSTIYAYENTGSISSPTWTRQESWEVATGFAPALGDLDGDGDYDMIIGNADGVSYAYENTASHNTSLFVGKFGNIGIGTTSPYAKLSVWGSGTGTETMANFTNSASTTVMSILNNGNVGIGNSSPSYALDVTGFINTDQYSGFKQAGNTILYASSTNYSLLAGEGAGASLLSDGLYNTAIGYETLNTATSTDSNTAVGYRALRANTDGENNVAVGSWALYSNTSGDRNIAIGRDTLYYNTTGSGNTAMGYRPLRANTTGYSNTAIGNGVLYNNTTGYSNTAVGSSSLYSNTTGLYNSAFGDEVLYRNSTGRYNVAMGASSLANNYSATSTTAIGTYAGRGVLGAYSNQNGVYLGYQSGYYVETGSDNNTMIGYKSGYANTTGANNIYLGYQAGDNITTGSNNLILGYDIDAPSATGSNQLNIGNLIFGTDIDGTGTTISSGNIGIGTVNPNQKLEVVGTALATRGHFQSVSGAGVTGLTVVQSGSSSSAQFKSYTPSGGGLIIDNNPSEAITYFKPTGALGVKYPSTVAWTATSEWNVTDVGANAAPALMDMDNDGDYDLLIGAADGISYGYENTGTYISPTWTANSSWDTPDVGTNAVPAFADLDNDGDYDLLIGASDGISYGYENTGTVASPTWTAKTAWNTADAGDDASPTLADLDNDGDYDLIVNSTAYENTGSTASPTWTANTPWDIDTISLYDPILVDMDNDGDYDLLFGSNSNAAIYGYENVGTIDSPGWKRQTNWDIGYVSSGEGYPAIADLDNDGDYDLLVGGSNGITYAQKNTGTQGTSFIVSGENIGIGTLSPKHNLEIDGDLFSTHAIFQNTSGVGLTASQTGDTSIAEFKSHFPTGSNLIVDTSPNKAETNLISSGPLTIKQKTDVSWAAKTDWNGPTATFGDRAFADLDNDGDLDLLLGGYGTKMEGYENTGSATSPNWVANSAFDCPLSGSPNTPSIADLDGDGDYDVVTGSANGEVLACENEGTASSPNFVAQPSWDTADIGYWTSTSLADLDNDGDYDLMVGRSTAGNVCGAWENTGTTSVPEWTYNASWNSPDIGSICNPDLADLDNDGDYDLIATTGGTTGLAYENTGTASSPAWTAKTDWNVSFGTTVNYLSLADLDNDGDKDVVAALHSGVAFENTGTQGTSFFVGGFGNIGIGTTSPYAKLSVWGSGTGTETMANFTNSASTTVMSILNNGNVGIGNSSPSYALDVTGFINTDQYSGFKQAGNTILYASSTNASTLVGINAGAALLTDGTSNTAIGYDSLKLATSTDYNTAIGARALKNSISGSEGNVAVGFAALTGNTTGSSNVALGYAAMEKNTTESYNTAVGYGGLRNTTAGSNTAVGYNAGIANITGGSNVVMGHSALVTSKTGSDNVAIGASSLNKNVSATSTVAIGYQAAYGATGYSNQYGVYLGSSAGVAVDTGSDNNTMIGYKSGYANTTGANNIYLGYQAGDNITTGSNNLILGYDIDATSATGSNQLNIGNLIFGTGIDGTGTTISSGNIGIGTTTPISTLSVQGSLCVRDTGSCGTTAGTIYATTASITDIDLAENYPTLDDTLSAGEIVSLEEVNQAGIGSIKRAIKGDKLFGVISTAPGILLGQEIENGKPVALKGRVPILVNNEGGNIKVGDRITISSIAGIGTKATTSTGTLGIALESLDVEMGNIMIAIENEYTINPDQLTIMENGNIGIGTTTPEYKLHVIGDVAAHSFVNVSTRGEKKDINYLTEEDEQTMFDKIKDIKVASYKYNTEVEQDPIRIGLIAEESPQEILSASGKGVDIYKLSTFILSGVQVLVSRIDDIETRLSAMETRLDNVGVSDVSNFDVDENSVSNNQSLIAGVLNSIGAVIENGIAKFDRLFAYEIIVDNTISADKVITNKMEMRDRVTGDTYCIEIENGEFVKTLGACENTAQIINESDNQENNATSTSQDNNEPTEEENSDTTPPTLTLNGINPSTILTGDTYSDMGVTVIDDVNENLGYSIEVNGVEMSQIQINTVEPGTHTIKYTAVDQAGNSSSIEREVIVEDRYPKEEVIEEELVAEEELVVEEPELVIDEEITTE